jgi:protoporphyrinogen oxidase
MWKRLSRDIWQCGSRILSTHSSEPSLQEKAISVHEAVKEEITTVTEESGFQDVIKELIVELLESHSVVWMNEELAGLDRQTYKEA